MILLTTFLRSLQGTAQTRTVAENTASDTNIGDPVSATDADDDTLTYSLSGTDAESFSIVSNSGQLQTSDALDYETKTSYTVIITAYDGNSGGDTITVMINVTDVSGAAPSVETSPTIPDNTDLLTNFPNPFNPETWIPYQLAKPSEVTLTIYDMRGVVVRQLQLGHKPAGVYSSRSRAIHWDGRNSIGEKVASGVYFYMLKVGDFFCYAQDVDKEVIITQAFTPRHRQRRYRKVCLTMTIAYILSPIHPNWQSLCAIVAHLIGR